VSCSKHDMFCYSSMLEPERFQLSFSREENLGKLFKVTSLAECVEFLEHLQLREINIQLFLKEQIQDSIWCYG
jgi:hypothetical protein